VSTLVTGVAGFIGMHVAAALLERGEQVLGIDDLNSYYDVELKQARLRQLATHARFRFQHVDIADRAALGSLSDAQPASRVVHLAAQAGVRHSVTHPHAFVQANVVGFLNVLEWCRAHAVEHLVYASSSSVYGAREQVPFAEDDPADRPLSLYAATKRADELMAHSYGHLFALPTTGLRFFTVYGPWGRPDMAYWRFTQAVLAGEPIDLFNHGRMSRDFTFIDDAVDDVLSVLDAPPSPGRLLNVGSQAPATLTDLVQAIEQAAGRRAIVQPRPMPAGDVPTTCADVTRMAQLRGRPRRPTPLAAGIARFVQWYCAYHQLPAIAEGRAA
jgi:UDP-glucuronate 4-epimerase